MVWLQQINVGSSNQTDPINSSNGDLLKYCIFKKCEGFFKNLKQGPKSSKS